ncbi:MAG: helix-turn-helix domain-containing protein, partial [Desulfotignum sp.]|nr:helix-turn-helix domain-containing protein [Desulfotignum sp.]
MEKLLNVRQAAELLNVSQMTVRRWTNAGLPRQFCRSCDPWNRNGTTAGRLQAGEGGISFLV